MELYKNSRKCPHCGQWSEWHQAPDDKCQHCGNVLDPYALKMREQREEEEIRQKNQLNIALIEIHPDDPKLTRFGKRIIQAFQISLMAIVSFIIWLVTIAAG